MEERKKMKKKILLFSALIVMMLLMIPFASAFHTAPEKKSAGIVTIHVKVYNRDFIPCSNATVTCRFWFGYLIIPLFLSILEYPFMILFKKTTDENGKCTFYRTGPILFNSCSYVITAQTKTRLQGSTLIDVVSGEHNVTLYLCDFHPG